MADEKIKYGRCALVGASGAKPERLYGKEIDEYDVVVRMNFAPTKNGTGREHIALVGSKTNLRVLNSWAGMEMLASVGVKGMDDNVTLTIPKKGEQEGLIWQVPWVPGWLNRTRKGTPICPGIHQMFGKHMMPCLDATQEFMAHLVHLKATRSQRILDLNTDKTGLPSSGFYATGLMLHLCSSVDLYGFNLCDRRVQNYGPDGDFLQVKQQPHLQGLLAQTSNKTHYFCHYYTKQKDGGIVDVMDMQKTHMFGIEHQIYHEMEQCGILKVHR